MTQNPDLQRETRRLRLRIARLRRRIDGRVRSAERSGRKLLSWRAYVQRWPGNAVAAALGAGLAVSAGLSAGRLSRWIGLRLMRQAGGRFVEQMRKELAEVWKNSAPGSSKGAGDA